MQGDRSLVCVQTENPGAATRPCCVSCWACRGEANAFSFPVPPAPRPGRWEPRRGCTRSQRRLPLLCLPLGEVCRVGNLAAPPTIQEPSCALPGACVLGPQPCPLPWDATCPPGWVPAGLAGTGRKGRLWVSEPPAS